MQSHDLTDWQGKMLGRYRLGRLLGRGGMGEVWQAEDTELQRQVAAKILPPVVTQETDYLRAFADEARTAAALDHPHIVQVHDFGEEPSGNDVVTYLIMPLIPGGSLRDRIRNNTSLFLPVESLHYLRQAAQAIDYAHSRRVLHRDIKPANMLLQQDWLFLADFGIAKLLATNAYRSRTHAGAGTPEYMAPEQVQGKAEAASDLYSLAIIAYQLFSGHLPFTGKDPFEVLFKQMQETPPLPRQFNGQIPPAVERTLLKGLAKQPEQRPVSCVAFVDELEMGWKMGPAATHDPEATLLAPWSKRAIAELPTQRASSPATPDADHGTQVSSLSTMEDAFIYPSADMPATPMAPMTTPPVPEVPGEHKIGRRGVLIAGASAAGVAIVGGTGLAAYLHFRNRTPLASPPPPPGPRKLIAGIPLLKLTNHTFAVWDVVWHPGGRYLATGSVDTHVMLWDVGESVAKVQTGTHPMQNITTPLRTWKFADEILSNKLGWSADGHALAVLPLGEAANAPANIIHMITDQQTTPTNYSDKALKANSYDYTSYQSLAWSPVENLLAVTTFEKTSVELWQHGHPDGPIKVLQDTTQPQTVQGVTIQMDDLAWSYDGSMIAGIRDDYQIVIWNIKTGNILHALHTPETGNGYNPNHSVFRRSTLTWSPHDRNLLVISNVEIATVFDAQANTVLYSLATDDPVPLNPPKSSRSQSYPAQLNGLAWSPNGRYIAGTFEYSHQVYIWDTHNKNPKTTKDGFHIQDLVFGAHNGHLDTPLCTIIDLAWSPDGRYLATASNDKTVILWKVDGALP